jgi:hypothetical protein
MQRDRLAGYEIHPQSKPVDNVGEALPVYSDEAIADGDSRLLGRASGINFVHDDTVTGIFNAEASAPKPEKSVIGEDQVAEDARDGEKHDPRAWAGGRHGGL